MRSLTSQVLAANVRARMAWFELGVGDVADRMGWTRRTAYNKLHAITPFSTDEVDGLAQLLGCEPGDLFSVPDSFSSPSASSETPIAA